jgi:hypothetical protein
MVKERPIWGIHMGKGHARRPIDESYIAIGWSKMGNLAKLPADRDDFKKAVAKTYPQIKPGAIPVVAGTLFKFAYEMKIGISSSIRPKLIAWSIWVRLRTVMNSSRQLTTVMGPIAIR